MVARAAVAAIIFAACAPTTRPYQTLISRLDDRGPVALSPDNPYLVANLFLSKEMETSAELRGFIKHRGAPAALEVERSAFGPLTMYLYYPESREHFVLEDADGAWIITGPFAIEREKMTEVARLTRGLDGEPPLAVSALPPSEARSPVGRLPADVDDEDPFLTKLAENETKPRTVPEPFQSPPRFEAAPAQAPAVRAPANAAAELETRIRELARSEAAHQAELTPRGDLVHHVSFPGETLSIIARWYTDDRENAGRIARINRLPDPNLLSIGDEIVIPSYLVRNKTRLTPGAMKLLTDLAARERGGR